MNGDEEQNENAPVDEQRLAPPEAVPEQIEASAEQPAGQQDGAPAVKPEPVRPKGPRIPLPGSLQEIVGALLFASETPLTVGDLRSCVRGVAPEEGDDPDVMSVYQSCTTREIEQALRESVGLIIQSAKNVLEKTPPELSADIIDRGVILTGGGALLHGIDQLLMEELKVPVFIAENPMDCVAVGTGIMLDNIDRVATKL